MAGSKLRRADSKAGYCRRATCVQWSLSPLGLACAVLALETCFSRTNVAVANYAHMSIDEALMEAYQSSNESGLLNDPSVIRVQIDMLFPADVWSAVISEPDGDHTGKRRKRQEDIGNKDIRWRNGLVPYTLDTSFSNIEDQELRKAIADYDKYTCIRFRPRTPLKDTDFVKIGSGQGCASFVGRQGGDQYLKLGKDCRKKRIISHEFAHVIGFVHEHSRLDRDDYVTINMENVGPDFKEDFTKVTWTFINTSDLPYDYKSVMHYGETAGSRNKKRTIETKNSSYQHIIGKGDSLSFSDVKLINTVYRCSELNRCPRKACPEEGFVGHDCRCWCPSRNDAVPAIVCRGCLDFNEYCPYFKARGLCNKSLYREYLLDVCPKSCGSCAPDSA